MKRNVPTRLSPSLRQRAFELWIDLGMTKKQVAEALGMKYPAIQHLATYDHWNEKRDRRIAEVEEQYEATVIKMQHAGAPQFINTHLQLRSKIDGILNKKLGLVESHLKAGHDVDAIELKELSSVLKNTNAVGMKITGMDVINSRQAGQTLPGGAMNFNAKLIQVGLMPLGKTADKPSAQAAINAESEEVIEDF